MTDGSEILNTILSAAQIGQQAISNAMTRASSTGIKSVLASQLQTYDHIESEALILAAGRGWDTLPDLPRDHCRNRRSFRRNRADSQIAESLIHLHTDVMIRGLKISHRSETYDKQINELFQNLLFCQSTHIRQMQSFL